MRIAYVKHPVSKEQKAKYKQKFDRIIDLRYKPEEIGSEDQVFDGKPKRKRRTKKAEA